MRLSPRRLRLSLWFSTRPLEPMSRLLLCARQRASALEGGVAKVAEVHGIPTYFLATVSRVVELWRQGCLDHTCVSMKGPLPQVPTAGTSVGRSLAWRQGVSSALALDVGSIGLAVLGPRLSAGRSRGLQETSCRLLPRPRLLRRMALGLAGCLKSANCTQRRHSRCETRDRSRWTREGTSLFSQTSLANRRRASCQYWCT